MIHVGQFNKLKVLRSKTAGLYLEGTDDGILLPTRFVPDGTKEGEELNVFLYHDSEGRLIATTQKPAGCVGDIVLLRAVEVTSFGAFLDFGLMKDLLIPQKNIRSHIRKNGEYLVKIILDEKTGRLSATEYLEDSLSNEHLTVKEMDEASMTVYRKTQIGYEIIINNRHRGILHFNEVYRPLRTGDHFRGFVKRIFKSKTSGETLIDVVAGKPGYARVEDESDRILRLLEDYGGRLPYNDKSDPEAIYNFFKVSKKTFKMAIGKLYKQQKIMIEDSGIRLIE